MRVRKSAIAGVLLLLVAVLAVPVAAEEYVFVDKWGTYGTGDGEFDDPWGVAVDSADNVYVAELGNNRIQKFDSSGNFLTMWGSSGTGDGQFQRPQGVAVDTAGNVYVTDDGNSRVQKFDDSGRFITAWGSTGSDDGNFSWPAGIAVNAVGNIYVADAGNNRIQKFTGSAFLIKWGSYGTGDGQFDRPWGIAVDSADNVYVVDNWNHRIQKFDPDGTFLTTVGSLGANEGQFLYPQGVTVDSAGNVYVADTSNYRIQKFDADGTFLTMWGSSGYSDGQFWSPWSVAVDSAGNVYVADRGNNRIQKFAPIPIPTITGIAPNSSTNAGPVSITDLSGTGFIDGAAVKLTRAGEPDIVATNVSVISSTQITCTLDLTGAAAGSWNVVVTNPGEQPVTLANGFTVTARNQAPVAANDTYTADEGVMLSVDAPGVLANDSDPDGDPLTAVLVDDVSNGTLDLNADGSFTYMPNTGLSGIDTFTYTANDGFQSSSAATVSITVNPASAVLTSIVVTPAEATLDVGATQPFTATGYNQHGDPLPTGEIVWSSTNTSVGTIDTTGLFTAAAEGSTTVTAAAGEVSGTAEVTVIPALTVTGIAPASGPNTESVSITDLSGTGFADGATVNLTRAGEADIAATDVSVLSLTQITCTLDLTGVAVGSWNVVVTNPDERYDILPDGFAVVTPSEVVTFNDPGLEAAVREALGKPEGDITAEDMAGLTALSAYSRGIRDLSGLEYAVNLQTLQLNVNQISDLGPLAGLTNLQYLRLDSNRISDLGPLASLTNLWYLHLYNNQISDLGPLAGLTNLQTLDLSRNQISDLGPLAGLTNLRRLELYRNQISDLGPLAGLTNLQYLRLDSNQISDLGPLAGMTNLQTLYLGYNQISDIGPLVANTGLGSGDYVELYFNYLDLTPGSAAMNDIQTLQSRRVFVGYSAQKPVPTYTLDLTVNPEGSGTVTGAGTYAAGAAVSITATPNEGWAFVNWTNGTGTPVSSGPDFDYAMPARNTTLIANFESAPSVLTGINVSPAEATLDVGATQQFTATGYDQYGDPLPTGEIAWSSTNDTVGTIDATGLFTATAEGSTTVTAAAGEVSGTAEVTVTPALIVTGIAPNSSTNTGPVSITDLSGTGFADGATVKLTRAGEADIAATDVTVLSSTQITCTLDLTGAAVGPWSVMVTNPGSQSATLTDGFTVNAGNRAPNAEDDTYTTDEDTLLTVAAPGVLENDNDPDGDTLTVTLVASTTNGTLTLNPDGSFVYTPESSFSGTDSFTYTANDSVLESNAATVTITVNPVNEPPTASDDTYATDEDTPLTIAAPGVLGNDDDPDGDTLTATLVTSVTNGTLALNTDGSFAYTPNTGFSGTDTFTYKAFDNALESNAATVTITVNPVNKAPTAADDTYTTDEDTPLTIAAPGVLENDNDPDGDTLTATLAAGTTNGTLTLNPDGSFTYAPNNGFSGTDSFTYKAFDGNLDSNTATVTITVNPVNKAPTASDDNYATDEGTALTVSAPGVLENDDDPDGDALTAVLAGESSHGSVTLNADGSFTYTPDSGFSGSDSFTYKAFDGNLDSNTATVTITVNPVNEAPTASDDDYATDEGTALTVSAPGVLANDDDPDGDALTAALDASPGHGTLTLNPDGSFIYTPESGFSGTDSFTYTASDGALGSATATVTITVNPVNKAPTASDDTYATDEDTPLTIAAPGVLANDNDPDGDTLTATLVASTTNGTLALNPDGSFTYTPDAGFSGTDSFTYTANDSILGSNTATVTITVNPVNKPPTAQNDAYGVDEGEVLTIAAPGVLENDNDPDGDALTAVLVGESSHGSVTLNADGSFTYTPDPGFSGSDSFTYRASDGELESETATVTITVTATNHPPVAVDDACTLEQDTTHTEPAPGVLANDNDPDGDGLTAVLENSASHGSLTLNADGSFTYTPNAGWSGTDSFTYKAFDNELYSAAATVTITVTEAANNPPEVTAVTTPTDPQLPGSQIQVTGTFTDPDADDTHTATWNWGDGATNEGTVDEATGTVTGSHTYTAPGTYTIILTVTDSKGASDTGTTSITVQTPAEATTDLISQVESLSLPGGIESGLTSKLDSAIAKINEGNEKAAINNLNAFINQVKAQRGKKIPAGEADALIAMVQRIIESM